MAATRAAAKDKKIHTEAELLKMPESAYMNEAQLEFFRGLLQQMERELLHNAKTLPLENVEAFVQTAIEGACRRCGT